MPQHTRFFSPVLPVFRGGGHIFRHTGGGLGVLLPGGAGFGMVVGNLVSGRLSDKYTPGRVGMVVQGMICIVRSR